ncbi:hypothetical protein QMO17_33580, partial [Klebsiella pneumoniae]|nr:hypothetical protein [Klebsiella pneumoniae]
FASFFSIAYSSGCNGRFERTPHPDTPAVVGAGFLLTQQEPANRFFLIRVAIRNFCPDTGYGAEGASLPEDALRPSQLHRITKQFRLGGFD